MTTTTEPSPRAAALAKHLAEAQAALAKAIADEVAAGVSYFDSIAAVTDPIITPFFRAMRAAGWIPATVGGRCLASASNCPHCRRLCSRNTFFKNGVELQCCVYCDE